MTKEQIIERLAALPGEIAEAEDQVIEVQFELSSAKLDLENREAECLLGRVEGVVIDGKNAEARAAQLRLATKPDRDNVADWEIKLAEARQRLNRLLNEMKCLRSIAALLANGGDAHGRE